MGDEGMHCFDLSGVLRRIRRCADLSQRQLAEACGVATSVVAQAESGRRGMGVDLLARAAAAAGLRLALLDVDGVEVRPMTGDAVRDRADRRFPAHLDTRHGDDAWWHGDERYSRPQPWYTFDRDRRARDARRAAADDPPDDHQLPRPDDDPADRRSARRLAARRAAREQLERRRAAGELTPDPGWVCDCPPDCDELEDWQGPPRHTDACPCRCDPC